MTAEKRKITHRFEGTSIVDFDSRSHPGEYLMMIGDDREVVIEENGRFYLVAEYMVTENGTRKLMRDKIRANTLDEAVRAAILFLNRIYLTTYQAS